MSRPLTFEEYWELHGVRIDPPVMELAFKEVAQRTWIAAYNAGCTSMIDFGVDGGWDCPKSPSGKCEYNNGDRDQCDHCGEPEERK